MRKKVPMLTVDGIVLRKGKVLLIKRSTPPYKGHWALPGGFVEHGETVEEAVAREIKEETDLTCEPLGLVGVYSDPKRDPRGHTITLAYILKIIRGEAKKTAEATEIKYFDFGDLPEKIAFDHEKIICDARKVL
ncbi:MAG: NUDIX hydrolase [Candidatus Aenigmarchaeota archaeon]|nr:NUDIX hydrolase [Candidatus Aenigmarchaeota archaeon]